MAEAGRGEEFGSICQTSEEVDAYYCQPCINDGLTVQAEEYCVDCHDYCTMHHRRHVVLDQNSAYFQHQRTPTPTRKHLLPAMESMPRINTKMKKNLDTLTDTCPVHEGENIKYFCRQNDALGCNACMMTRPQNCKTSFTGKNDICYIPDISGEVVYHKEFIDVCKTLKSLEKRAHSCREKAKANVKDINTVDTKTVMGIQNFRRDVNEMLDELESVVRKEALAIKDANTAKINSIIDPSDTVQSEIQTTHLELETLQKSNLKNKMFITMQKAKFQIKNTKESISKLEKNNTIRRYEYEPPKQLRYLLNSMTSLGKLTVKEPEITKATHVADIDIKPNFFSLDYEFTGLAVLYNDQLAVVDFHNQFVKLADTKDMKILSEICFKSKPYDVTETVPGQIAITLPAIKTIKILSAVNELVECYDIIMKDGCTGIACESGDLIVCLECPCRVQIIDLPYGNILKNIAGDIKGPKTFLRPHFKIATDNIGSAMYMASDNISCLTMDGDVTSTDRGIDISDRRLRLETETRKLRLRDIAVDKYGAIYVCGYYTHTIYRKRPSDGAYRRFLKRDNGIEWPISLAYCAKKTKLYVGMRFNKSVKIYQLEQKKGQD